MTPILDSYSVKVPSLTGVELGRFPGEPSFVRLEEWHCGCKDSDETPSWDPLTVWESGEPQSHSHQLSGPSEVGNRRARIVGLGNWTVTEGTLRPGPE